MQDRNGVDLDCKGGSEKLVEVKGAETHNQKVSYVTRIYFK